MCLEYIAENNLEYKAQLYGMIENPKVTERAHGSPIGCYIYFDLKDENKTNNHNIPVMLDADINVPEFGDNISFIIEPNTNSQTKTIFLMLTL